MKIFERRMSWMLSMALAVLLVTGCKDDDNDNPAPVDNPNAQVNTWIYENMDLYYLWTDQLPSSPDYTRQPEDFFEGLLSNQDRFSVIVPSYTELINGLDGIQKEAGYEFVLFRESQDNDNVIAVILYIKSNSPAETAGLVRGDIITQVNGTTMTINNFTDALDDMSENHDITFLRYNNESNSYEQQTPLSLDAIELAENPNHIARVFDIDSKKIGYFMYNFFAPGTGNNTEYDDEMDQIFADFKAQGVTNLILDLRYNSGGSVASARNLASLIAPGVTADNVFYENQWNDELQDYIEGLSNGDDILRGKFAEKADNIGTQLEAQTIYILVGSRTASASELMINGLMPYMNVEIIGEQTIGKNVGSIPIEDTENEENDYGLLPIVFQTYNSAGESNYANGFIPEASNTVDEFAELPLAPLGELSDPLIARTMQLIGVTIPGSDGGRMAKPFTEQMIQGEALKYSLDDKVHSQTMFLPSGTLPVNGGK